MSQAPIAGTEFDDERANDILILSPVMTVKPEWIDYNGHLNMAYYNVLFDNAVDEALNPLGLGPDYVDTCNASYFTAETHINYKRELAVHAPVQARFRIVDADKKRIHYLQELFHAEEGWLSAISQSIALHVDLGAKKVVPWPDKVFAKMQDMRDRHAALPPHPQIGATIAIPK